MILDTQFNPEHRIQWLIYTTKNDQPEANLLNYGSHSVRFVERSRVASRHRHSISSLGSMSISDCEITSMASRRARSRHGEIDAGLIRLGNLGRIPVHLCHSLACVSESELIVIGRTSYLDDTLPSSLTLASQIRGHLDREVLP